MAKKSAIQKNLKRERLVKKHAVKRAKLKGLAKDDKLSSEERFNARLKLAQLPRNNNSHPRHCWNPVQQIQQPQTCYK